MLEDPNSMKELKHLRKDRKIVRNYELPVIKNKRLPKTKGKKNGNV